MSGSIIKVSVVQACTASYGSTDSLALTLAKLERFTALAKKRDGSQLAVFPEAFIGGYPYGTTFGASIGARTQEGREEFLRYAKGAVEVPSEATSQIEAISSNYDIFLVVGVIERDLGTLYCTVIFVHPKKGLVGKHRKLMPTASERLVWGFGDGSTLPVPEESFWTKDSEGGEGGKAKVKMSATICWENYMPLLRTYYYSKGTQLYCAPTVDARPNWQHTMVHIALEGRCHVLSACQLSKQKDYPHDHELPQGRVRNPEDIMIAGGSVIVSPLGEILSGPLRGEEGVLSADVNLDEQLMGKFDMDSVGHYSRNDIFELIAKGVPPA